MPAEILMLIAASLGAAPPGKACIDASYAHATPPKYPPSAVAERLDGTAILRMLVGTDGVVRQIVIEKSSGNAVLDDAATAAAASWTFNPARCDGEPAESWVMTPFRFGLDDLPNETAETPPSDTSAPAAPPRLAPVRQIEHVVEPDAEPMEFSTFTDGERVLARMGLEKQASPGLDFYSGGKDLSRIWMAHRAVFTADKAFVRVRSRVENGRAMHRYAIVCEGSEAWCEQLRKDTEVHLRKDPPPIAPPPPPLR